VPRVEREFCDIPDPGFGVRNRLTCTFTLWGIGAQRSAELSRKLVRNCLAVLDSVEIDLVWPRR
jgi:hypothetical protein